MVHCGQRSCVRVLRSGSSGFIVFDLCTTRSPQLFSNGLAHFPFRLRKPTSLEPLSLHLHLKVKNPESLHFFLYLSAAEYLTTVVKKKNISYVLKLLPSGSEELCLQKRSILL
jgi:hypothetical protein